ncbi:MAG: acyl-ACP--UDP-N-acetylglucosamine O-acyltransferase [Candidatus Omnitrophica bacterium]|nr:acyl-ACP--UDP-N-acetylglucosamine O-acyltransferase [Candidatus Omnitrophota bacterium]
MSLIHPNACVHKKAKLDPSVQVGPFAVIDEHVQIGAGTVVGAHAVITGHTTVGKDCRVFSSAVVGSPPQDLKFKGEKSFLSIGDNNTIREFCTINPGTGEGGKTLIGNHNLFMAYAHVAHDCRIGDHNIFVNNATLGGHVVVEDHCLFSALSAAHQFVRIGRFAIIGGCSKVVQDIPPFAMADGHPARVYGLNLVGLKRNNVPRSTIKELDKAFKILFESGLAIKKALESLEHGKFSCSEVAYLVDFIKGTSRGVIRSRRSNGSESE